MTHQYYHLYDSNGNFHTSYHVKIISKYMYKSPIYFNLFCSNTLNFSPSFFDQIYLFSKIAKYTFDLSWFLNPYKYNPAKSAYFITK